MMVTKKAMKIEEKALLELRNVNADNPIKRNEMDSAAFPKIEKVKLETY
jgi:hypothetical protein